MVQKAILCVGLFLAMNAGYLQAQSDPAPTPPNGVKDDFVDNFPFWQANVGGGQYLVKLSNIVAVSRHKYVLDGSLVVDEVTVDTTGQGLTRFYFIKPLTDEMTGTGLGKSAARLVDRGREIVEKAADVAGTNIQDMVIKKFPETTHAREIEYRILSEEALGALYGSVKTAWMKGRGRIFSVK